MPAKLTCPLPDGTDPRRRGRTRRLPAISCARSRTRRSGGVPRPDLAYGASRRLTGLPKGAVRRHRAAPACLARSGSARALLLLDSRRLQAGQRRHGHPCGVALLKAVADRLRRVVAGGDLLARLGGDVFAVVCGADGRRAAGPQTISAIALAERIVAALRETFTIKGIDLSIGTSIGIAPVDGSDQSVERLLLDGDAALYRAKAMGRGTWCLAGTRNDKQARGVRYDLHHVDSCRMTGIDLTQQTGQGRAQVFRAS